MSALEREQRLVQGLFARAEDWLAQVNKQKNTNKHTQTFTVTHTYTHTNIHSYTHIYTHGHILLAKTEDSPQWLAQVKTILSSP